MENNLENIKHVGDGLIAKAKASDTPETILRSPEMKQLFASIATAAPEDRANLGQQINKIKVVIQEIVGNKEEGAQALRPIDITAPFDENVAKENRPSLLPQQKGSAHPLLNEIQAISDIFSRMGFYIEESRQLDSEYNMFTALNFPENHPARDDYDTFLTEEGLIPPAHTSTMQNRILKSSKPPIRAVIPGRTYRNEDVDATHEHTFYQIEGVYVDKNISLGDMVGTIVAFLENYFGQSLEYKTQPFFFPFVEPGLEFLIKKPEALKKHKDDEGWMEIMGCGMIHPNVLAEAGIDSKEYSGFAFGVGVDRLVMLKHGIEDVRHFHSAKLDFLRSF